MALQVFRNSSCEIENTVPGIDEYFERRTERSANDFKRLLVGTPENEQYLTEHFGYEH